MTKVSWIKTALTVGGQADLDRSVATRPEMNELYEKHFTNNQQNRNVRSVVKWVDKLNSLTPLCLLHGGLDKRVSVFEALEFADKLSNINHPYSLHILNSGDHLLHNVQKERDDIVFQWFKKYLKSL
jgi:dipeptidyl aminopeptidase/acylaminoacyl peptidase